MNLLNGEIVENLEDLKDDLTNIKDEENKIKIIKYMIYKLNLKYTWDGKQLLFNLTNCSDKALLEIKNLLKKC